MLNLFSVTDGNKTRDYIRAETKAQARDLFFDKYRVESVDENLITERIFCDLPF